MFATVRTNTAKTTPMLMDIARETACAIADVALDAIAAHRWTPTPNSGQAYLLAIQILALESELGPVCEAAFAERHITAMAHAAHLVAQHARQDMAEGNARLSRISDWQLLDGCVDEALMPAYAIVAFAVAA